MSGRGRIFRRGRTWWIAYYHRGREYRESTKIDVTSGKPPTRVANLLARKIAESITGKFIGPEAERYGFDQMSAAVERDYVLNGRRSLVHLKIAIAHLATTFKDWRAVDITTDEVEDYKAGRKSAGMGNGSINRELAALSRMFHLAVENGRLSQVPLIKKLKEPAARQGFLSPAEFDLIARALPKYLADPTRFLYLTGWRVGEMRSLEWRDVDLQAGTIRLRPENSKNGLAREIPFSAMPELAAVVKRAHRRRRLDCARVFHHDDGAPIGNYRKAWIAACTRAKFPGRLIHDLRRSAVRNMVRAGISRQIAMLMTGHRTESMLNRYDIRTDDDLRQGMERLAAYLKAQPSKTNVRFLSVDQEGKGPNRRRSV